MKNIAAIANVPLWAWVLVGWMTAGAVAVTWERGALERAVDDVELVEQIHAVDWDLDQMSAREMRTLPGIGEKRAVDIVEARWEQSKTGEPFDIETVDGIGEKTAQEVRTFRAQRMVSSRSPMVMTPPSMPRARSPRVLGPADLGHPKLGPPPIPRSLGRGPTSRFQ